MSDMFNADVFVEIGEAIGNIGRKLFPRRTHAKELDESFRRHLQDPLSISLPDKGGKPCKPDDFAIEGVFTVLEEERK